MENAEQMQTQATAPAVVNRAAMKAGHRTGTNGDSALQPASPTETYGVNPQVAPKAASGKPSPEDCTTEQLFEIVVDVAQSFRTAKDVVAENKEYILRLKADVFKVSFGSVGVRVLVACKTDVGREASRKMNWREFCESEFGASADWINRICGGKAESRGKSAKPQRGRPENQGGYEAEKKEMQAKLTAAAKENAALAKCVAELEKENEKLRAIADGLQKQLQESVDKTAAKLPSQVEKLRAIAGLAEQGFEIVNGELGNRLMGSVDGKRLVDIAKKVLAMRGKLKVL